MLIKGKELAGALKAALLFASTDETREQLNCVHLEVLEVAGNALRIVSTDGHTLWCCEVPARDSAADPPPMHQMPWNLRINDAEKIAKLSKDKGEADVELLLTKRTADGVSFGEGLPTFPPYARVVPDVGEVENEKKKQMPEFAAEYIARACEAFAFYSKGFNPGTPKTKMSKRDRELARNTANAFLSPPIAWRCNRDEFGPSLIFSPKFPAAFAVVMPRKGDGALAVAGFIGSIKRGSDVKAA